MNTEVVRLQLLPCSQNYAFKNCTWRCYGPLIPVTIQVTAGGRLYFAVQGLKKKKKEQNLASVKYITVLYTYIYLHECLI